MQDRPPEVLDTLELWDPRWAITAPMLALLGVISAGVAIARVLTRRELTPATLGWLVGGALLALAGLWLHRSRKRSARFVRDGGVAKLVIPRGPELAFPIDLRGTQTVIPVKSYSVGGGGLRCLVLELKTADGRAVVLHELRDNAEPYAWLDGLDAPEQPDFVVMPDTLARIRERVEELNAG